MSIKRPASNWNPVGPRVSVRETGANDAYSIFVSGDVFPPREMFVLHPDLVPLRVNCKYLLVLESLTWVQTSGRKS